MDEMEGRVLHASLLSLCCPWVPLPLLDGSWEMASGLCRAGGCGVGSPKAFPSLIPSWLSLGLGAGKGRSVPGVLAPREGEERWRQPRFMLPVQEQREEGDSQGQR